MNLHAQRGMIREVTPGSKWQRRWVAGMRIFHVDPIKAQERKTRRKGSRRAAMGAGKDLLQPGLRL